MKYIGYFFGFLLLISSWVITEPLTAEEAVLVKSLKGRAIVRAPLSPVWQEVQKDQKLNEGWILQVMEGAAIELSLQGDILLKSKIKTKELVVTIEVPLIIRIDSEMVRQTKQANVYLDELPVATEWSQNHMWQNAFARVNAVLNPKFQFKANSKSRDLQKLKQDIEVSENVRSIKIIQPSPVDLVVGSVPIRYSLRWSESEQSMLESDPQSKLLLYIWHEAEERGQAFAEINKLPPYTITLKSYGDYFVQLESEDGKASSSPHIIQVKPPLPDKSLAAVNASSGFGKKMPNGPPVFLRYPKSGMSFILTKNQTKIPFTWQADDGYQPRQWALFDHEKKLIKSVELQKDQQGLLETLKAGSYTWSLVYSKGDAVDKLVVESHFVIESLNRGVYSSLDLTGLWQKKTVFLDDGL